ncbi:RNA polymerase sigma-70 factor [Olivibacter ginsenosidimutans]|uniref:RNA polymerase sigma-70 factor n=1 Tax=Olivibacter ginsenosidimutans TaxID=1176537 RepID=A0ABP9BVP9_9SPHI
MQSYRLLTDQELFCLLADHDDHKAFTTIYDRYWKKLFLVAAKRLDCLEDAEEVVQDIFVSLWNRRQKIQLQTTLSNYLAVSIKYKIINTFSKYHNQQQYIDALLQTSTVDNSTQEWLAFEELQEQLAKTIHDLPEKCRLVYQLSRDHGFSQKQIAQELQIAEKTVEAHLNKATKTLRAKLSHFLYTLL